MIQILVLLVLEVVRMLDISFSLCVLACIFMFVVYRAIDIETTKNQCSLNKGSKDGDVFVVEVMKMEISYWSKRLT